MSKLSEIQKVEIKEMIASELFVESEKVLDDSKMQDDLNCDSLDYTKILMETEKIFDIAIPDEDYSFGDKILVSSVYDIVERYIQ